MEENQLCPWRHFGPGSLSPLFTADMIVFLETRKHLLFEDMNSSIRKARRAGDDAKLAALIAAADLWLEQLAGGEKRQLLQYVYLADGPLLRGSFDLLLKCEECGIRFPPLKCICSVRSRHPPHTIGVAYCNKKCQLAHWKKHKKACKASPAKAVRLSGKERKKKLTGRMVEELEDQGMRTMTPERFALTRKKLEEMKVAAEAAEKKAEKKEKKGTKGGKKGRGKR